MATNKLERIYTIPLRSDFIKVPKYYRAKRAISQIRKFVGKHMKTEDVRIGNVLNEEVWSRGIKNPPGKVIVKAIKEGDFVTVELEGYDYKTLKVQTEKTEKPTSFKDKLAAKLQSDKSSESEESVAEDTSAKKKDEVVAKSDSKEDVDSVKSVKPAKEVKTSKPAVSEDKKSGPAEKSEDKKSGPAVSEASKK